MQKILQRGGGGGGTHELGIFKKEGAHLQAASGGTLEKISLVSLRGGKQGPPPQLNIDGLWSASIQCR